VRYPARTVNAAPLDPGGEKRDIRASHGEPEVFETARPFLLALAIGLLIGIERERAKQDARTRDPLGSRTFTLLALLGAVAAHMDDRAIAVVLAVFTGAIVLAGYFRTRLGDDNEGVGVTTEVAAMATFVLGYLARREAVLAVMLAVITLVVLALKPRIHQFARAGLTQKEVSAALTFLVIAFVVLPLLPDRPVDPWKLLNPARLWMLLVIIAGIGFGGYLAVRWLGPRIGLALAGLTAGLVSSTAATGVLAQKYREGGGSVTPPAAGIVLANVASAAAQLVVVAVIFPAMLPAVVPVIGAAIAVGAAAAAGAVALAGRGVEAGTLEMENPLALKPTIAFAAVLATVLVVTSAAARWFGSSGVQATALLGGTASAHAVTLAVSTLAAGGSLGVREAVLAVLLGFLSNMAVKLVLAWWVGGRRLLLAVAPPMIGMMLAGVLAFLLVPH
jgi:uncharacterized membrane protein (DUF4010 family)